MHAPTQAQARVLASVVGSAPQQQHAMMEMRRHWQVAVGVMMQGIIQVGAAPRSPLTAQHI